jgi:hypothetical protein
MNIIRIEIVGRKMDQTRITTISGETRVLGRREPQWPASGWYFDGEWVAPLGMGRPVWEKAPKPSN